MPDFDLVEQFEAMQNFTKSGTPDSQFRGQLPLGRNTSSFRQAANDILWATTSVSFGRTALARPNESREWPDISPEISSPITGRAGKVQRR